MKTMKHLCTAWLLVGLGSLLPLHAQFVPKDRQTAPPEQQLRYGGTLNLETGQLLYEGGVGLNAGVEYHVRKKAALTGTIGLHSLTFLLYTTYLGSAVYSSERVFSLTGGGNLLPEFKALPSRVRPYLGAEAGLFAGGFSGGSFGVVPRFGLKYEMKKVDLQGELRLTIAGHGMVFMTLGGGLLLK